MKITIPQDKLSKALLQVARGVSTKPNIPVLSNILLEVSKDQLKLSSTNLDMGIHMWIPGSSDTEGKTTVSGKFIADFVAANSGGKVELALNGEVLHVHTDSSKAEFNTISSGEFPILPKVTSEVFFTVEAKSFIEALDKVLFTCASDFSGRIQLTGVLMEINSAAPDKLVLAGADGFRLSQKTLDISSAHMDEGADKHQLIVPARPLQEFAKMVDLAEVDNIDVYVNESKSQLIFKLDNMEFSVRLLEGPYPDFKQVIPVDTVYGFDLDKAEFERAMKIVNTFARSLQGYNVDFDLDIESGQLVLRSRVVDLGVNETKMMVKNVKGPNDLKAAYSLQLLMDMVNHAKGNTVTYETNGALAPALFTDQNDKDYIHLVMPMQRVD